MTSRRRGSVYALVIGVSVLVALLALTVAGTSLTGLREVRNWGEIAAAHWAAVSGVEYTLLYTAINETWRQDQPNGTWFADQSFGEAAFTVQVTSPTGNFMDDAMQPATIVATGIAGTAARTLAVEAASPPLNILRHPLHAQTELRVKGSNVTINGAPASSNGNLVVENGAVLNGDARVAGIVDNKGIINGTASAGQPTLRMPDPAFISDLIASATLIPIATIPGQTIEQVILSPFNNPYTLLTNPQGVYLIDCNNKDLTITNARIIGTLIIINHRGGATKVTDGAIMEPAVPNYPVLINADALTITIDCDADLDENDLGINFNPAGHPFPYPDGASDTDTDDVYTRTIYGMIYSRGGIDVKNSPNFQGVLISEADIKLDGTPTIDYSPAYYQAPLSPAWLEPYLVLVQGTWRPYLP